MPATALATLRISLATLRSDPTTDRTFVKTARSQEALFKALPPQFEEVWLGLVDRLARQPRRSARESRTETQSNILKMS